MNPLESLDRERIKPFLFVCSDGYIIDALGPYPATNTDADIINNEFSNETRHYFQSGDIFILDRGFRGRQAGTHCHF